MSEGPAARWQRSGTGSLGDDYAARFADGFDELERQGADVHGEARFVEGLLREGGSVLDAGCGTGRVAQRLDRFGFDVVGVDADPAMIEVARQRVPEVPWHVADLADLDLGRSFDVIVMAGNVVGFLDSDLVATVQRLAEHLVSGGMLVCGYGLDADHLPQGARAVPRAEYDAACGAAGLAVAGHYAGWDGAGYDGGGYSLSVHVFADPGTGAT